MIDLYLKADSEAALKEALPFALYEADWVEASHEYAIDIIGTIYDENGELVPGFHANLRCDSDIADCVPANLIIHPATPVRRWF